MELFVILIMFMICGGVWQYFEEKREWNNGICQENQTKWEQFDTDSQGGRGYKAGKYYCWNRARGTRKGVR